MKKILVFVVAVLFIVSAAGFSLAGDKVVGEIKGVLIKIADEKSGKIVEVDCENGCKVKRGTTLQPGEKVTLETKAKTTTIRKAVAGC